MAERYRAREKTVVKAGRDGLCEENLATQESKRISGKAEDAVLEKTADAGCFAVHGTAGNKKKRQRGRYQGGRGQRAKSDNGVDGGSSYISKIYTTGRLIKDPVNTGTGRGAEGVDYRASAESVKLPHGHGKKTATGGGQKSGNGSDKRQKVSKGRKRLYYRGHNDTATGGSAFRTDWKASYLPLNGLSDGFSRHYSTSTGSQDSRDEHEDKPESQSDEESHEIHRFIRSAERDAVYRANRSIAMISGNGTDTTAGTGAGNRASGLHERVEMSEFRESADSAAAHEERRAAAKRSQKKAAKKRYQKQYRENKGLGIRNRVREAFGLPQGGIIRGSSGKKSGSLPAPRKGKHWKRLLAIVIIFLVIIIAIVGFAMIVFESGMTAIASTTYQSSDEEIHSAEDSYKALEDALDRQINEMEQTHPGYDEYRYQVDEINHNPFQLISYLTALYGEFTADDVRETLNQMFQAQYTLNVWETTETRKRTVKDPVTGKEKTETYEYRILNITLTNHGIDYVARQNLTEDQYKLYEIYNLTSGNRPELFDASQLPSGITTGGADGPTPEALSDVKFEKMYNEAQKYLGYPYVWGGSSPSTSFDCSGFVSWVINNSGNGWNVGRCTAEGLRGKCSYVSADEAKPGDLIFFKGTYATRGASHVGIVIGDGKMIHCGKPIQIASYKTPYWNKHFYQFGRIR